MTDVPAPPPPLSFEAPKEEPKITQAPVETANVLTPPTIFPGYSSALVPTSGYSIDDVGYGYGYGYGVPFSSYLPSYSSGYLPYRSYGSTYAPLLSSAYVPPTSIYRGDYLQGRLPPSYRPYAPRGKHSHPLHPVYRLDFSTSKRRAYPSAPSYQVPSLPPTPGVYLAPEPTPHYDPRYGYAGYFPRPNPRLPDAYTYHATPYRPYAGISRYSLPSWNSRQAQQTWKRGWGL